jgi:ADP-glucose pyrophosphorylase
MRKKGKARKANQDVVAEGVWLTAETMEQLLFNHLQGGKTMTETLWKCDQLRAGRLYNRMMFDTQAEALHFAQKMQQMEPDQTFAVEAIEASQVWN